ncbi:hypothetical protein BFL38_04925 [Brachyspira hampsonii]|uniref:Glycosyltransferase RgtA/B/C/D-like domain-containing protein n=1 Tax=Brachyspira hampsonii TaxID=1287055 RepID=A0A1E5ND29_9SPIR|nr:hypothetical protein [Brachyspira hampsonii]OEJ14079.1 hypothetical protein BFL38_04925 [Brachyspira hampsonii]
MKNRNIFYIVYIILLIVSAITLLTLSILGSKTRIGYIEILKTYENTYPNTFRYYVKVGYYNKIFRHSDIYGVYVDTNKVLDNNNFIKEINMDENGSAYGNVISSKVIDSKIDNIEYTLKLKKKFIISIIIVYIIILFIYLIYTFISNKKIVFYNIKPYKYKTKILYIILIMLFGLFVRLFWAYQQEGLYWDEYHSLNYLNKGEQSEYHILYNEFKNILGYEILRNITIDNSSIKDCFDDIKRLYKNTNDPFISNLYYSLLRLAFIGREAVSIKNIIMTGAILNCIFFIISFIFLYKTLKLIFEYQYDCILFSLLIMSLSPISISFSMFLRAYQMQETFFVVITYLVINTIYNNKYSIKNLIITAVIAGIGYLTLYSSMLFVLILSAMLFINYVEHFKNIKKIIIFNPLIKIESYKVIIYYAVSFISALLVSRLLYASFFSSLFNANGRASTSLKFSGELLNYINNLSFDGLIPLLSLLIIVFLFFLKKNNKDLYINLNEDKFKLLVFIIVLGIIYALLGDLTSPFKLERYSATSYILILFIFPLIFSMINNNKIKYIVFILISIIYIYNVTNSKRFSYFEKTDKDKYVLTENIKVYSYKSFYVFYEYNYLNTNLYYTYIDNENDLTIITNYNKFYFLINEDTEYILTNNLLKDYQIQYLTKMNSGTSILKLDKK